MSKYRCLLRDGTVGSVDTDTLDGQHPDFFLGDRVNVQLHNENGMPIEKEGVLIEVLEEIEVES